MVKFSTNYKHVNTEVSTEIWLRSLRKITERNNSKSFTGMRLTHKEKKFTHLTEFTSKSF